MKKQILSLLTIASIALAGDYTNSIGMKFKEIPSGSFVMGSSVSCPKDNPFTKNNEYEDCLGSNNVPKHETPAHRVTLKSFYMAETEVTQGQWYGVMGSNPAHFQNGDANMPIESVSWDDAKEFIKKLNAKEKTTKYRLPTEEEWEYAARAGTATKWYCGDNESCVDDIAWYGKNSGERTHRVATKNPNAWGLYDMSGNVWEWTDSCWTKDYNSSKDCSGKVYRGGSCYYDAFNSRSAFRFYDSPGDRSNFRGFRLLRTK